MTRALCLALLCLLLAPLAEGKSRQEKVRFTTRSELSPLSEQAKRLGWDAATLASEEAKYTLSEESFRLYLPRRYNRKKTYGLLVWVGFSKPGRIPTHWERRLDKLKLIGIGADNSGNERHDAVRIGLALDALSNLSATRNIDPKRVFVAGFSGGGQVASFLALHYPERFPGAIYVCGCDYYRNVPVPDGGGKLYQGQVAEPTAERLDLARANRHVYLTGEQDPHSTLQTQAVHQAAEEDGFKRLLYLEVPKMGHVLPPAKWFERSVRFLDGEKD